MVHRVVWLVAVQVVEGTGSPVSNLHSLTPREEAGLFATFENRANRPPRAHFVHQAHAHAVCSVCMHGCVPQEPDDVGVPEGAEYSDFSLEVRLP